ncbi:MAG: STAS domain-containing protein [Acidimicrobiales bacterium]
MPEEPISIGVRTPSDGVAILDIAGDVSSFAENRLMDAYTTATSGGASTLLLNFSDMDYMNSSGIGLLVTLLVRAQRRGQQLGAYGLDDHYRQIFDLTRLNEAIAVHDDESAALESAP